ncbi:short-chain fatty acyl-CoA regulator family protein [Yoonia sp. BS5-3]|uniref:Short-chain fatty acyl-CoA regulator family protein n=1 Tax=Yoonia phaeophyticola TaxID=3137369 RepID=A0ABZ2VBS2_9RHOB
MAPRGAKIVIGAKLKRLRRSLNLTQAQMAQDLDVSPSYITLIEANQRPISARLLVKLAQIYDFSPGDIDSGIDLQLQSEIAAVVKDPVFGQTVPRAELEEVVGASPALARGLLALYGRYRDLAMAASADDTPFADREKAELLEQTARPVEDVREHFHARSNYVANLDSIAEDLAAEIGIARNEPQILLSERLKSKYGYDVRIRTQDFLPGQLRLFDPHRKCLNLSERLDQPGRRFQIALTLAKLEYADAIEDEVSQGEFTDEARPLARESFASYFAAALLMPYGRFLNAAENEHYDIQLLCQRFGASYEQVAHRLTTLQRPSARGVPFFFVRVDQAGNVSKRFSAGRFHFSRFGGSCPLWNIHDCFDAPDRVHTQVIEMPDGTTYFSIAKSELRHGATFSAPAARLAIGLGCDIAYAPRLIYAKGLIPDQIKPAHIGVNCYLCERQSCASRAYPPLNKAFAFSDRIRGISSFSFDPD